MLGAEGQMPGPGLAQVQVAVAPGVQVRGASQGVAVMHHHDGGFPALLPSAQAAQDRGQLGGGVLIDLMQAGERIQNQQPRADALESQRQALAVMVAVQAQLLMGMDQVQVQLFQRDAHLAGDGIEALAQRGGERAKAVAGGLCRCQYRLKFPTLRPRKTLPFRRKTPSLQCEKQRNSVAAHNNSRSWIS